MILNLRKIDLNLLVVFEALYSTGNTHKAAERLGMSQPAVSNALGRLRDLIGDPLFVRDTRGIKPTSRSREIIQPVRDALAMIGGQIVNGDSIDLATYRRLFRIIVVDALEPLLMPPVVRTIAASAPGIEIECIPASAKFADQIREGTVDLACFAFPIDMTDLVVKVICPTDMVVISRRNHPAIKKPLDAETMLRLPQIALSRELRGLTGLDRGFTAERVERRTPYLTAKIWSIPPMVQRTDLIGIMPRWFAQEVADNFQLDIHDCPIELAETHAYMVWHVNRENDPGHRWLRESMLSAMLPR